MASDDLTQRVEAAIARSREKLAAARHLLEGGFGADAVSPVY